MRERNRERRRARGFPSGQSDTRRQRPRAAGGHRETAARAQATVSLAVGGATDARNATIIPCHLHLASRLAWSSRNRRGEEFQTLRTPASRIRATRQFYSGTSCTKCKITPVVSPHNGSKPRTP